jgi:hypothetical protein
VLGEHSPDLDSVRQPSHEAMLLRVDSGVDELDQRHRIKLEPQRER